MLKVLLVDDERKILKGLKCIIDWGRLGYKIIGACCDPHEAIELAREELPDLIITDVRMPAISGLDMINILKNDLNDTRFVILSGYDDFEYAQKAIEVGACSYILKPVDEEELIGVLERTRKEIENNKSQKKTFEHLRNELNCTKSIVKAGMFIKMLEGRHKLLDDYERELLRNMDDGMKYKILIIQFDKYFQHDNEIYGFYNTVDVETVNKAVGMFLTPVCCLKREDMFVYLIQGEEADGDSLEGLKKYIYKNSKNSVTIGLSLGIKDVNSLSSYFNTVCSIYRSERFFKGKNNIYILNECSNDMLQNRSQSPAAAISKDIKENIRKGLFTMDIECINGCLNALYHDITSRKDLLSVQYVRNLFMTVFAVASDVLINDLSFEQERIKQLFSTGILEQIDVFEDIIAFTGKAFNSAIGLLAQRGDINTGNTINQVKYFIRTNYWNSDISLETVAGKYYLNPSYLSHLFKKATGVNFSDYILSVRLDEAKRLLRETNLSAQEIASRVGYKNEKNFYSVFKKAAGISPNKFRKSDLKN